MKYEVVEANDRQTALERTRYRPGMACITEVRCSANDDGTYTCWPIAEPISIDTAVEALRSCGYVVEKSR